MAVLIRHKNDSRSIKGGRVIGAPCKCGPYMSIYSKSVHAPPLLRRPASTLCFVVSRGMASRLLMRSQGEQSEASRAQKRKSSAPTTTPRMRPS